MKENLKRYSIFTLLIMVCNFFMPISMLVANASSNLTVSYLDSIDTLYNNVSSYIDNEIANNPDYLSDEAYKKGIDTFDIEVESLYLEYQNAKSDAEEGISFNELMLNGSGSVTLDPDYVIEGFDVSNLPLEVLEVYTIDEVCGFINDQYFKDYFDSFTDFDTNKVSIIDGYKTDYNNIVNTIDNIKLNIDNNVLDINNYIESEEALGNSVYNLVDDKDVLEAYEELKLELDEFLLDIDLLEDNTNKINEFNEKVSYLINSFNDNNKTWEDNGLKLDIDNLILEYTNTLNTIDTDTDFNNVINSYLYLYDLDSIYQDLMTRISNYLEVKPSYEEDINTYIASLVEMYNRIPVDDIIKTIHDNYFNDLYLSDNENVKILTNLVDLDGFEDSYKEELFNRILTFKGLELKDNSNYDIKFDYENIVIYGLKGEFNSEEFINNFREYNISDDIDVISIFDYDVNDLNKIINITINDNYKLGFIINSDIDNNNIVNEDDLVLLTAIYLEDSSDDYNIKYIDINNDDKFDMNDIITMSNSFGLITLNEEEVDASYRIESFEDDNNVYYEIYLDSNGIVNGIDFKLGYSSDILLSDVESEYDFVYNDQDNIVRLVGLGDFDNGNLLVRLTFEKQEESETTIVNLNGSIYGYNEINDLSTSNSIYRTLDNEEESNEVVPTNNIVSSSNDNDYYEEDIKEVPVKEDNKIKEEKIDDKNNEIIWGSVIKVIIVVFLGTLIIYFLNKNEDEEFFKRRK